MSKQNRFIIAIAFIFPALCIYLFYFILPIPLSGYYSFFKWDGISTKMDFIGFSNWISLFVDPNFWQSLLNNLILIIASICIQLPIGLFIALLVSSKIRGNRILKLVYFLPMLISSVAIGLTWILLIS